MPPPRHLVPIPSSFAILQLICLSATLPNIECLAKWLDASLYRTAYRPVELRHFVCQGRAVYRPTRIRGTGEGEGEGAGAGGGDDEGNLEKASGGNVSMERCRLPHLSLSEVNNLICQKPGPLCLMP